MLRAARATIADDFTRAQSSAPEASPRARRRSLSFFRLTAVIGAALLTLALPAGPAHARDDLFGRDKFLHFGVSAGLAVGGYAGTSLLTESTPRRLAVGGGLSLLAGVSKEIADRYHRRRPVPARPRLEHRRRRHRRNHRMAHRPLVAMTRGLC